MSKSKRPTNSVLRTIRENFQPAQWRQIPTEYNVADDVSLGLPVAELSDRW